MAGEPLITVVGNVVADPEPRVSQAGNPWVTFRIASTPRVRDRQSGDWTEGETLWLGCRAYGDFADNIASTLQKGMRVVVQGRLTQRSYTDNQGQQRSSLDLEVDEIGPSLRWATAQVQRSGARGQVGDFGGGSPQGQSSWGSSGGNRGNNGSGGGANDGPWGNSGGNAGSASGASSSGGGFGGDFDDDQPF